MSNVTDDLYRDNGVLLVTLSVPVAIIASSVFHQHDWYSTQCVTTSGRHSVLRVTR